MRKAEYPIVVEPATSIFVQMQKCVPKDFKYKIPESFARRETFLFPVLLFWFFAKRWSSKAREVTYENNVWRFNLKFAAVELLKIEDEGVAAYHFSLLGNDIAPKRLVHIIGNQGNSSDSCWKSLVFGSGHDPENDALIFPLIAEICHQYLLLESDIIYVTTRPKHDDGPSVDYGDKKN